MNNSIEDIIEELVLELLEPNVELVDVEYVKEHSWYLRIYIDKQDGIDINDCQQLSEALEHILDSEDIIKDSYILEVSSPGIERVLRKPRDYVREKGKKISVSLYAPLNGLKNIVGELVDYDGEMLTVGTYTISMKDIAQVRLHVEF